MMVIIIVVVVVMIVAMAIVMTVIVTGEQQSVSVDAYAGTTDTIDNSIVPKQSIVHVHAV
jgi:flagellar basal body-associated protein FliL